MRSQRVEPAGAVGGGDPPSEGWAALSGERGEETRRSMDGAAPAEDTDNQETDKKTESAPKSYITHNACNTSSGYQGARKN